MSRACITVLVLRQMQRLEAVLGDRLGALLVQSQETLRQMQRLITINKELVPELALKVGLHTHGTPPFVRRR